MILNSKIKRTAQLGLLSKDLATIGLGNDSQRHDEKLQRIVDRIGLMRGLPQKIGQLLAFGELEGSDKRFLELTEKTTEQIDRKEVARIEELLGGTLDTVFAHFETQGISASIGRVHRAILPTRRHVAVKVQHPGISDSLSFDLKTLGWLTKPVGGMGHGFDMASYRNEIGTAIHSELNYRTEARNIRNFQKLCEGQMDDIIVPEVFPELSGETILTTSWTAGAHISVTNSWTQEERTKISRTLLKLFLSSIIKWGVIHADPHPGNYRFLRNSGTPKVGLIDFGCIKSLSLDLQGAIVGLIDDQLSGRIDNNRVFDRFLQMGFNSDALIPMKSKLGKIGSILFEPFTTSGDYDVSNWNLGPRLKEILGEDRMTFRTAGPSDLIYILRSFQGLICYLKYLDTPINWTRLAWDQIESIPQDLKHAMNAESNRTNHFNESETLHILVTENGQHKVSLSFGAKATDNLSDLIPFELRDRLAERSIDLRLISKQARSSNYAPGELFSLEEDQKKVRVWLD